MQISDGADAERVRSGAARNKMIWFMPETSKIIEEGCYTD